MNTFICFAVLFAVASANHHTTIHHKVSPVQSSWGLASSDKVKEWDGSLSYVSPVVSSGYFPSSYYYPSAHYGQAIHHGQAYHHSPAVYHSQPVHYSAEVAPKVYSQAVNYKVVPSTWSEESYVPSTWTGGYYSAGLPVAKVEKQVVAKAISAPAVKVEEVAVDVAPKPFQYSTEIVHDVPAKREEVVNVNVASPVVPAVASRSVSVAPQVATVNKVVSTPLSYSAWGGEAAAPASGSWVSDVKPATWTAEVKPATYVSEVKPVGWTSEVKPASWAAEVKPAVWTSDVKPATYVSEVKPVGWTSEVKPASWAWAQPKPAVRQASWTEVKPASWSSWSEAKPYGAYVSPIQPAFYGAEYPQTIVTNAHHAVAAPWSSTWSNAQPVDYIEFQKRSGRKQF